MKYFVANLPVILVDTSVDHSTEGIKNAACILFIAPMLIVYMIVQRWFIESIDRVGITG
jgi:multiple sugar transport system permease protein